LNNARPLLQPNKLYLFARVQQFEFLFISLLFSSYAPVRIDVRLWKKTNKNKKQLKRACVVCSNKNKLDNDDGILNEFLFFVLFIWLENIEDGHIDCGL
jgi:hypothetical protein